MIYQFYLSNFIKVIIFMNILSLYNFDFYCYRLYYSQDMIKDFCQMVFHNNSSFFGCNCMCCRLFGEGLRSFSCSLLKSVICIEQDSNQSWTRGFEFHRATILDTLGPRNSGKFGHPEFFRYCGVFRYFASSILKKIRFGHLKIVR